VYLFTSCLKFGNETNKGFKRTALQIIKILYINEEALTLFLKDNMFNVKAANYVFIFYKERNTIFCLYWYKPISCKLKKTEKRFKLYL